MVKKVLFALALSTFSASVISAQPTPPAGYEWESVNELTDEFTSWDESKWMKSLWNYGVPVQMREENSGVTDGNLWIKATLDEGAERWFKTSRIQSKMQISYPMYTECRMRTSDLSAFSTFWMNNGNGHERDEIDMCESNSNPSRTHQVDRPYTLYSQYFVVHDGDTERDNGNFDNRRLSKDNPAYGKRWNEEYQVIGVWWKDKNNIQFYINGEEAGVVQSKRDFTRDLNIIWDLWTDDEDWTGGLANPADLANDDINTMYVDWIHTYRLVEKK